MPTWLWHTITALSPYFPPNNPILQEPMLNGMGSFYNNGTISKSIDEKQLL